MDEVWKRASNAGGRAGSTTLGVYGHIHEGYTTEERPYNRLDKGYERVIGHRAGKRNVNGHGVGCHVGYLIFGPWRRPEKRTTLVNATVGEGWENYALKNEAVILLI